MVSSSDSNNVQLNSINGLPVLLHNVSPVLISGIPLVATSSMCPIDLSGFPVLLHDVQYCDLMLPAIQTGA